MRLPLLVLAMSFPAFAADRVPVIVELFTSEGCSSCPSADAALAKLVQDQPVDGAEVIALGMHVDYWDYIGWRDPYSSPAFTERQREYSQAFGGDRIYTPQLIVDGAREFSGASKAPGAIRDALARPKAKVLLRLVKREGSTVEVGIDVRDVPHLAAGDEPQLMLALTEGDLVSKVTRGENAGRTLAHASVVRQLALLGDDREAVVKLSAGARGPLKLVAFVQGKRSKRIVGAGTLAL